MEAYGPFLSGRDGKKAILYNPPHGALEGDAVHGLIARALFALYLEAHGEPGPEPEAPASKPPLRVRSNATIKSERSVSIRSLSLPALSFSPHSGSFLFFGSILPGIALSLKKSRMAHANRHPSRCNVCLNLSLYYTIVV